MAITSSETIQVYAPGREFLLPYLKREFAAAHVELSDKINEADVAILSPGDKTPDEISDGITVLFCPNIVGTGMTGLPMDFVRRIARGSFYHLDGNEARLSTIHATDVARAVSLSLHSGGSYTVTDGDNPTFHDFAEALAHRLNQKRILTLSSKWVKWIISPSLKKLITTDAVVDGCEFAEKFNFKPTPVVTYLKTHVYDDESL